MVTSKQMCTNFAKQSLWSSAASNELLAGALSTIINDPL